MLLYLTIVSHKTANSKSKWLSTNVVNKLKPATLCSKYSYVSLGIAFQFYNTNSLLWLSTSAAFQSARKKSINSAAGSFFRFGGKLFSNRLTPELYLIIDQPKYLTYSVIWMRSQNSWSANQYCHLITNFTMYFFFLLFLYCNSTMTLLPFIYSHLLFIEMIHVTHTNMNFNYHYGFCADFSPDTI